MFHQRRTAADLRWGGMTRLRATSRPHLTTARHGPTTAGQPGTARPGKARQGRARHGTAKHGSTRSPERKEFGVKRNFVNMVFRQLKEFCRAAGGLPRQVVSPDQSSGVRQATEAAFARPYHYPASFVPKETVSE
jgi:hypothetical protein